MIRALALLLICSLAACAGDRPLAEASGPLRPLNPGRWIPSEADLHAPSNAGPALAAAGAVR